jgi:hypothetical protein
MTSGLLNIQTVSIPGDLVQQAHRHLQKVGKVGNEGVALWAGKRDREVFFVTQTIIPAQTPLRLPSGVCYFVDATELHRLNVWLYKQQLTLIAQLHSHPEKAYHSPTDDAFPIVTTIGSFSLVIPNFAQHSFILEDCAIYRLHDAGWVQVSSDNAGRFLRIDR